MSGIGVNESVGGESPKLPTTIRIVGKLRADGFHRFFQIWISVALKVKKQ
jgi:hypothetical protein